MNTIITNKKNVLIVLTLLFNLLSEAQTNNPAPYCLPIFTTSPCNQPSASNTASNTINHFINSVVTTGAIIDINNVNSGCNGLSSNYIYYCQQYLQVFPNQVITCSVQSGINFNQSFALFVDWDQNGNFDIPFERLDASTNTITAASWFVMTFTVPQAQQPGTYRMRIRCYSTPANTFVDPCSPATVGETEDYNLYVGNAVPPPLAGVASYNSPMCTGQTLILLMNHNGSSNATYSWSGPGGFLNFSQNPTIANATSTVAGVYVVNVSDGPCSITRSVAVNINPTPTVTAASATICAGDPVTLIAGGASSYSWSSGQTTQQITVIPVSTSVFTVTGTSNGCTAKQTTTVTLVPSFTMDVSSTATLICPGVSVTLNAMGANSYSWSTGSTSSVIVISPSVNTSYTVEGTNGPCKARVFYSQLVDNCSSISERNSLRSKLVIHPNPFSRELIITTDGIFNVAIFNTLGQVVFQQQQLIDESTLFLKDLPVGVYYLSVSSQNNKQVLKIIKN